MVHLLPLRRVDGLASLIDQGINLGIRPIRKPAGRMQVQGQVVVCVRGVVGVTPEPHMHVGVELSTVVFQVGLVLQEVEVDPDPNLLKLGGQVFSDLVALLKPA